MDLIKSLIEMVSKLCGEVDHLQNDNASLKEQLKNLQDAIQAGNMGHQSQTTQVFSNKQTVERSVPPQSMSSYRDIVLRNQNTLQARAVSNAKNV
jgi:predicted  nucleic acid-binding Zn-ribbon protein